MASQLWIRRFMSYQIKGPLSNPKISDVSKPQKMSERVKVPYEFSMTQVYHIRGRYG